MENNNKDIFELTKTSDKNENFQKFFEDDNPFASGIAKKQEPSRRLNDYDSNILKDDAYKDIDNEVFKIEYRISKIENEIKEAEEQINAAEEIIDTDIKQALENKLSSLKKEHQDLLDLYNEITLSAKITGSVSSMMKKTLGSNFIDIKSKFAEYSEALISKMPPKLASIFKAKKSLSVLANINKSVDKLITMTVPYGENTDKYQQLSKYIIKANSIQSEISGYLDKKY